MARAKFLCDAERCIECNACVTACKNEHEVPWGINRRRVVTIQDGKPGRAVDLRGLHALFRCTLYGGLPRGLLLPERGRGGSALQGPLHRVWLLLLRVPIRRAAIPAGGQFRIARQDGQMYLLRRWPGRDPFDRRVLRNMDATGSRKANCRSAPRCVRPRPCWPAMVTSSPRSTANASWRAASDPAPGAGERPMNRKAANA